MKVPTELKRQYLTRRSADIVKLKDSLEANDFTVAMKLGHQVKGNAVTFDFPQMAFIGVEIENAAKSKDKERIKIAIGKMETIITLEWDNFSLT